MVYLSISFRRLIQLYSSIHQSVGFLEKMLCHFGLRLRPAISNIYEATSSSKKQTGSI